MKDEGRSKRGRPKILGGDRPKVLGGGPVVQRVKMAHGAYVQRYVKCGPRCSRCTSASESFDEKRPGHGPYWYFEQRRGGKTNRRYVGRTLKVIERDLSGGSVIVEQGDFADPETCGELMDAENKNTRKTGESPSELASEPDYSGRTNERKTDA